MFNAGWQKQRWNPYDIALTIANLLLAAYIIYLLLANYHSQMEIRRSAEERLINNAEKQAAAIGYYLSERRRDIQRLAADSAVIAYFENKALGMSPEYGLQASLEQARRKLQSLTGKDVIPGCNTFSHVHLTQSDGKVLISIDTDAKKDDISFGREAECTRCGVYRIQNKNLQVEGIVRHMRKDVGTLTAWVRLEPVLNHLIKNSSLLTGRWSALYYRNKPLLGTVPGPLPEISTRTRNPEIVPLGDSLVCLSRIPDTDLDLAFAVPLNEFSGHINPLQQLLGIGAVVVALLFGLIGFLRHHERKRMERAVHESEARLSLALHATNDGVRDWNYPTGEVYFSSHWLEMLGYTAPEMPTTIAGWEALIHPEDLPEVQAALQAHLDGQTDSYKSEYRCRTRSGEWKWILDRGRVISRDRNGLPLRIIGTHADISARKNTERMLAEANRELESRVRERTAMLLQSEKMASIGQLAAGVAHEINNPAGFVCGNLDVLGKYVEGLLQLAAFCEQTAQQLSAGTLTPEDAASGIRAITNQIDLEYIRKDLPELLSESLEGMRRIGRIVCDLKDFSHVDKDDAVCSCNLNELIDKAVNVAWNELKYKCEIRKEYGNLPPVQVNGGQISQVVLNLLVNAAQAIEKFGIITIRTRCEENVVRMEFVDNGPGIPESIRSRIFDPFFTTKPLGKGTGLGLHICQKIILGHGGTITVESKEGEGAAFIIRLPLKQSSTSTDAKSVCTVDASVSTGGTNG